MLYYILMIVCGIFSVAASSYVNSTYKKYSQYSSMSGMTGAQAAATILRDANITDVSIGCISGTLTDHYDPKNNKVNLSEGVYNSRSVSAIAVAAHECGHVIQHHTGYIPIKIRSALVPAANFGSKFGIYIVLLGLALGGALKSASNYGASYGGSGIGSVIVTVGVWAFALGVGFHIVTLPVEINASRRAMNILCTKGILTGDETSQGKKVLRAAALTYVASAAASVVSLLRIIAIAGGNSRGRRR